MVELLHNLIYGLYGTVRLRTTESQKRTAAAQSKGLYDDEIVPMKTKMGVKDKETGNVSMQEYTVVKDECNRASTYSCTCTPFCGLYSVWYCICL